MTRPASWQQTPQVQGCWAQHSVGVRQQEQVPSRLLAGFCMHEGPLVSAASALLCCVVVWCAVGKQTHGVCR